MTTPDRYDLVVIGSGPAGESAALHAALHGRRVALIEKRPVLGGAGVNTGTLPSKTLRESAVRLSGLEDAGFFRSLPHAAARPDVRELFFRERLVVRRERAQVSRKLLLDRVELITGTAVFRSADCLEVTTPAGSRRVRAAFVLIATGSVPDHPAGIAIDGCRVHDSDTILGLARIPASLAIVGAGVIGCEYATTFAALGTRVTLVNARADLLPFLDADVTALLGDEMRRAGIDRRANVRIASLRSDGDTAVSAAIEGGGTLAAEMFLFATGRSGNTAGLGCDRIGLTPSIRGTLVVDAAYRTAAPGVYAVGDVIGFPALGSTGMAQGRVAVTHMFNLHGAERIASAIPYGIYTIPEISTVGVTAEEAAKAGRDAATARVEYADVPRGTILGIEHGFLKLIYDRKDRSVLGVHLIGPQATELIHYGVALVENRRTLAHITGTVFNFPTLHELYQEAAYSAWPDA
jgi:NAD(P) transhydrogenase